MQQLAELPERARKQAMARFRLLEPHLADGQDLHAVAVGSVVSFRTLQRWVAQYRKLGLIAFATVARRSRNS